MTPLAVLAFGLVNWLVTWILTESELFREPREFLTRRHIAAKRQLPDYVWGKLAYVSTCQLCTGVWVGLVLVAAAPLPLGWLQVAFYGLLVKAVGHLILTLHTLLSSLVRTRR